MGLFGLGSKNRRPAAPSVFKDIAGFDEELLSGPLFRDLVICAGQVSMTDVDVSRLGDRQYLADARLDKFSVHDEGMQKVLQAGGVDISKLEHPGYIAHSVVRMSETMANASGMAARVYAASLNSACIAFTRFILEVHPEYGVALKELAPVLKRAAKG